MSRRHGNLYVSIHEDGGLEQEVVANVCTAWCKAENFRKLTGIYTDSRRLPWFPLIGAVLVCGWSVRVLIVFRLVIGWCFCFVVLKMNFFTLLFIMGRCGLECGFSSFNHTFLVYLFLGVSPGICCFRWMHARCRCGHIRTVTAFSLIL